MARPQSGRGRRSKGSSSTKKGQAERFRLLRRFIPLLTGPAGQQLLSVALILFGVLTLSTVAGLNSGAIVNGWARLLVRLFGWGAYLVAALLTVLGLLLLRHLVHAPTAWRWRPFLGLELTFVGLLALTHLLSAQDGWRLVQSGRGGGMVGWAVAVFFSVYFGSLPGLALLILLVLLGLGLAFDLTWRDLRAFGYRLALAWQEIRDAQRAPRRGAGSPAPAVVGGGGGRGAGEVPPTTAPARPKRSTPSPRRAPKRAKKRERPPRSEELPPLSLLRESQATGMNPTEIERNSRIIERTLAQFDIPAEVIEVRQGPTVTQFGVSPGYIARGPEGEEQRKVRVSQITSLADDLKLALAAVTLRMEAPVPGRAVVGIEVPNDEIGLLTLRPLLESEAFDRCGRPLCFAVGLDVAGNPVVADLAAMPHLLIAGTTGSGKSVFVKTLAASLIMNNSPEELRLVAIDPKIVELSHLNGLPHLLGPTETDLDRVLKVLRWVAVEMDNRYKQFAEVAARNLDQYNEKAARKGEEALPRIVVLIDELADLMMAAPEETERTLTRIAQMARATGIHLVVATQRPSTDVVTGLIKANFPARVSFATSSQVDSRVIIDTPGAESLLGRGDMLFLPPDASAPRRIQGCYISDAELEAIIEYWQGKAGATPAEPPWKIAAKEAGPEMLRIEGEPEDADYLEQAIALAQRQGKITTSGIQRRLRISYPRAARIMEQMEEMGIVGPQRAAGRKRKVLLGDDEDGL